MEVCIGSFIILGCIVVLIFCIRRSVSFAQLVVACPLAHILDAAVAVRNQLPNIVFCRCRIFERELQVDRQSALIADGELLYINRSRIITFSLIRILAIQNCRSLVNEGILFHRTHVLEVQLGCNFAIRILDADVQHASGEVRIDLLCVGEPSHGSACDEGKNNQDCYTGHCQFSLCAHFCFLLLNIFGFMDIFMKRRPRG